ncbi:pyruvate ferredoxin oxidoreductase subunit gamma [Candidatus Woesearchaeota archaeon]|nr:pyruvate ferredoxin oxidoreductase subunit gamma [Candidatus Woesearchaeota archaeon]
MLEIRIHGRGGQGAVTTGQILAIAAFYDKKESQTFPMFGLERMGAPVTAFVRINDKQINIRNEIYLPDHVIVLDDTLVESENVAKGIKKGGKIIINTNKSPKDFNIKGDFKVHCVDANCTAREIFGKPIVNTIMIGAFAKITKEISLESLNKAIDEQFLGTKGKEIADLNKKAIEKIYKQTK